MSPGSTPHLLPINIPGRLAVATKRNENTSPVFNENAIDRITPSTQAAASIAKVNPMKNMK
jgi:hypothetical protein